MKNNLIRKIASFYTAIVLGISSIICLPNMDVKAEEITVNDEEVKSYDEEVNFIDEQKEIVNEITYNEGGEIDFYKIKVTTKSSGDSVYHEELECKAIAIGNNIEYKWFVQNDSDKSWTELTTWRDSQYLYWTPDTYGTYVVTCMVRERNKASTMKYKSIRYTYCPNLKGICQMPNPEGDGGFLIGLETFDNKDYSYEMLILDVELYEQGKDAWIYTTGKHKSDQNCMWTIWKPQVGVYWTLFRVYDNQDEIIDERCFGFINTEDSSYPVDHEEQQDICPDFGNVEVDVTKYSYEITPLLPPFNDYFYVKTDIPDPGFVRFVDKESKYYDEEDKSKETPCAIRCLQRTYFDVEYEDKEKRRVKDGYIFVRDTGFNMDGGELVLQQADQSYRKIYGDNWISSNSPNYTDTQITVKCADVMPCEQYLLDNYTNPNNDFFDNMDSIQEALNELSLYPKGLLDTSRPNKEHPYPYFAIPGYKEQSMYKNLNIFEYADEGFLAEAIHPYVLDSLDFPGLMWYLAKKLEPNCEIKKGKYHYEIDVTYDGVTKTYGGSGNGTSNNLYSKYIEKLYKFDGSSDDFVTNGTMDNIVIKYNDYQQKTEKDLNDLFLQLRGDEVFKKIGKGGWIKTALGGLSSSSVYSYYCDKCMDNFASEIRDIWIDGRYIGVYGFYLEGVKFGDVIEYGNETYDTGKSSIKIEDVTFNDMYGNTVTWDAYYIYNEKKDRWEAKLAYMFIAGFWWKDEEDFDYPDELVLTREEVNEMFEKGELDYNANNPPREGFIYDGTAEPGTPFKD